MPIASRFALPIMALASLLAGCAGTVGGAPLPGDRDDVDDLVDRIPPFELAPVVPKTEIDCEGLCPAPETEGDFRCEYKRYTATDHREKFVAFQPNSATLWPGAVVQGDDAKHGLLTPVGVALGPMSFSLSLESLKADPSGRMEEPRLSAFRSARNEILSRGVRGATPTPAAASFEVTQIHDSSQFNFALGVGVEWPKGQVSNLFEFEETDRTERIKESETPMMMV